MKKYRVTLLLTYTHIQEDLWHTRNLSSRSREQKLTTKQITDAQQAIDSDKQTMKKLEEEIIKLTTHKKFVHNVQNSDSLPYLLAGYDSSIILNLIASKMTGSILSEEETELKTDNMEEIKLQKKEASTNVILKFN